MRLKLKNPDLILKPSILKKITEILADHEICHIQTRLMPLTTARKLAALNNLSFEIKKARNRQGELGDYYVFRMDTQAQFKQDLLKTQKWLFWSQWLTIVILSATMCLILWALWLD